MDQAQICSSAGTFFTINQTQRNFLLNSTELLVNI